MTLNDGTRALILGENSATFAIENYLQDFFFFNSPMDSRIERQDTKICDVFSHNYKNEIMLLHKLLYAYCAESADSIRILEPIISASIIEKYGDAYFFNYHSIFLNLDDKGELAFFEGVLPLDEFVRRYRLLCVVDALVGIGNTFWALDNLKKFKIFLNERAANILVKESHAITRSLSAFYALKLHADLCNTEKENWKLQKELIGNMHKHSSEMRNVRIQNLKESIKKLQFAYKISDVDIRHYKWSTQLAEINLENISKQPAENGGAGGRNKAYIEDLTHVIEIFLQKNPCVSVEKFKEAFKKQYHDGQPCTVGNRKYYISREDGLFYREGLENKHKEEYLEVRSSSLVTAYDAAIKNIKDKHSTTN